ncbi:AsmA family protein [Mycoplana rhizolycopersici]|uniref:AsmA family protein n=1 Tax=Mycoplana rhizolycopersici TaxID=2746702 RepID=A0ABX2QBB9_9HYPH|nr:AsmA family protein [Rhizobium rhizolycopersici]NVP55030.1 AsmA family protein [Rhizobium rhizolycopersici]
MGIKNRFRAKLLLQLFVVMTALVVVLRLSGPMLISSESVEEQIEAKVSAWTGAQLSFSGTPTFTFWPHPQMRFEHARLTDPAPTDGDGLLFTAQSVSVNFGLLGSLFGTPSLGEMELIRPVFHVRRDERGELNWRRGDDIRNALENRSAGAQEAAVPLPEFGDVAMRDGAIVVEDFLRDEQYRISDLEGSIDWSAVSSKLDVTLQGVINGEVARLKLRAGQPMQLLNGQNSAVRVTLESDPLAVDFDGTANLSANAFAAGRIKFSTPSFGHLLAWQGTRFSPVGQLGAVSLEGQLSTNGATARVDGLMLQVQDSHATGALDVSLPPKGTPRIGGTLAFDKIDLRSMIDAYSPLPGGDDDSFPAPVAALAAIDLDLRLSAREALLEPVVLEELAAGIRSIDGNTSLDIADAALLGGNVSGHISVGDQKGSAGGELQLSLQNADLGALVEFSGLSGPLPIGRGSADVSLFTDRSVSELQRGDISGTFRFQLDQGTIASFDTDSFEEQMAGNAVFNAGKAANGSFDFSDGLIEGRIERGLAELTKATFDGRDKRLSLSGVIPYHSRNVALAGSLSDRVQSEDAIVSPTINFLIGGSWPDPVISPVSVLTEIPAN